MPVRATRGLGMFLSACAVAAVVGCGDGSRHGIELAVPGRGESLPAVQLVAATRDGDSLSDWAQARGKKYGIPPRALQAYGYATVVMAKTVPGCHLGWTTLAAIARVESDHGRHRGAKIAANGQVSPAIRGVALDGTNGNARILDPKATTRTGNAVFAQAAGPFQFIPDTWKRWGVRASTDYPALSVALAKAEPTVPEPMSGSPDNIDDAALAAGRYLCASGGDLATAAGWKRAVFAYNHSEDYVRQVHSVASGYSKATR